MKVYFNIVLTVFATVLCYTVLTCIYGKKGYFTQKALATQLAEMKAHVENLQQTEIMLSNKISNLSYDYDTIKVYANELGYISEEQLMVKIQNKSNTDIHEFSPGQYLVLPEISYMSDTVIKTISVSVGIILVLIQMLYAYKKQGSEKINYDFKNRRSKVF
ncbi:MAG: septum formation initiator family protein [Treponemataceae bacterium]